jgi:tetratricopeptide (TPR) repeat protein
MKKTVFTALIALVTATYFGAWAQETAKDTWDAQARGFVAVTKDNIKAAGDWFVKAAAMAAESNDWQGTVAAGSSLSTIGEHDQAADNFKIAGEIAKKITDWEPSLAVGYAYASLPKVSNTIKEAGKLMLEAGKKAEEKKDWKGLIEVSRGLAAINEKVDAGQTLEKAETIINKLKDPEAFSMLARTLKDYGEAEKAKQYEQLAIANTPDEEIEKIKAKPKKKVRKKGPPPPEGWSAYGDSLAKPKKIDPKSSAILQNQARQILSQAEEQALMDSYRESYRKSNKYRTYYFYSPNDYSYRIWGRHQSFDLDNWAHKQLGNFRVRNGIHIRK